MIKEFIIKNLLTIHSGGVIGKIWASVKLAAIPAIGITTLEKLTGWYIDSQTFIQILVCTLFVDLILGIWKHLKLNTFSFKKMISGFSEKIGLTILFYFLSEALIQIISDADLDSVYVKVPLKLMMFLWLAGNALVNMGIITNGKFPPLAFLKRIKKFNDTLDVNVFKPNQNESENTDNNPTE